MGTLWQNCENLRMMSHSTESFEGEYDCWNNKVTLTNNWWLGSDAIPFQLLPYPHNTWQWVGLNWKFMYFSMGSLWTSVIGVTPKAASGKNEMTWKRDECPTQALCSSQDGRSPSLGGQAHGGDAYTRVCNWKVMVDDPHTEYDNSGLVTPDGRIKCCGASVPPLQSVKLFE